MSKISITNTQIPQLISTDLFDNAGSEIIFHGRVRDMENGQKIVALDYEQYEGMAKKKLSAIADDTKKKFGLTDIHCLHRIGRIPVGEISVRIIIWSKHRAGGLNALDWFITQLKTDVPIWKWGVNSDGERFPSDTGLAQ